MNFNIRKINNLSDNGGRYMSIFWSEDEGINSNLLLSVFLHELYVSEGWTGRCKCMSEVKGEKKNKA